MKTKFLFFATTLLLSVTSVLAQDVITFTWQAGIYPKDFYIQVAKGEAFTVDWGDGSDIETFTGVYGFLNVIHTYYAANNYLVTLTANTESSSFIAVNFNYKQMSNLNASGCTGLQYLYCSNNQLTSLNVSGCTRLQILYCANNQLTSLDISGCTGLQTLYCFNNQLTSIDVSTNKALIEFSCANNLLNHLDLSNLTMLKLLFTTENQITSIELNDCEKLETLDCSENQLKSLDVNNNKALKSLLCSHNQLTNLNISSNTKLLELFCYNNHLSSLDVSKCKKLESLYCHDNQLTNLDLNYSITLKELYCSSNQLTCLNARGCIRLIYLSCCNNPLSILDVGGCTRLEYLYSNNNQLTNLDINSCKSIKDLWVYNNRLPLSDLYAASEQINTVDSKFLGSQTLLPQQVEIGDILFSNQSVFNEIFTNYTITKDGNPAPENSYTVTDGKITFNKLGIYTVTMGNDAIVSNMFYPASVTVDLMVVDDAGVEENGETNIRVYPNPTIGELRIEISDMRYEISDVEIFDVFGKKLLSNHLITSSSNHLINISELPAGFYFVRIQTEKYNIIKKIVKH